MRIEREVADKSLGNESNNSNVLTDLEFAVENKYVTRKIPDGVYEAVLARVERAAVFKTPKVFVWVRITEQGSYFGTELYRAFRAHLKPGKYQKLCLKPRSDLRRTLIRLSGERVRADRVSLAILKHKVLKVKVRTVTTDYRQRALDECDQYSVIDDIISIETL
jgi:hypothetical protein